MLVKIYLEFLRWCLSPTASMPIGVDGINWKNLLEFAKKQTIVGLYWQGIQRYGDKVGNKPNEDEVMEWMGEYHKIVRRNIKVDYAVVKLAKILQANNISFFVFKGQSVARYYTIPESRTSGDVDFLFKKDWNQAIEAISKLTTITDSHSFRHFDFELEGIPFEMHYHTTVFGSSSTQKYWDDMIDSYFDDVLDHVDINEVTIPTLPPTTYAIYLFIHLYHHFLKEGVGLRQFIDWMMLLQAKHDEIVIQELTAKLEKLGLLRAFKAFGCVLVDKLGMDKSMFPYELNMHDRKYEQDIIKIILRYGNFGKYGRKENHSSLFHSLETGSRSIRHLLHFFWLSPQENLLGLPKLISHSLVKNISKH